MPRLAVLLPLLTIASLPAALSGAPPDGAALYEENCSTCHTIGEPDGGGPDLKDVLVRRDRAWVIRFIHDPEDVVKSGDPYAVALVKRFDGMIMPEFEDLSRPELAAIVDYIEARSGGAAPAATAASPAPIVFTADDVERGRAIFAGSTRLANAGPACMSCHDTGATTRFGGGAFGPGLARVSERLNGPKGVSTWLASPPTPIMRTVYRGRPVAADEARVLAAYFSDRAGAGAIDRPVRASILPIIALGLTAAFVGFVVIGVLWRERFRAVRRPLVSRARRATGDLR